MSEVRGKWVDWFEMTNVAIPQRTNGYTKGM